MLLRLHNVYKVAGHKSRFGGNVSLCLDGGRFADRGARPSGALPAGGTRRAAEGKGLKLTRRGSSTVAGSELLEQWR